MIFGSKYQKTAKLKSQRITVKSSEVGQPPLLVESSIVAVVKHCWLFVQERRDCRERLIKTDKEYVLKKILTGSVSHEIHKCDSFIYLSPFEGQVRLIFNKVSYPRDDWKMFRELASTG